MNQTGGNRTLGEKIKLAIGITLAVYGVLFVVLNAQFESDVWLFPGQTRHVPTLVVIVVTAVLTLASTQLIRSGLGRWLIKRRGKRR